MIIIVKILLLLVFATGCLMYYQNDYRVKLDRVEVLWHNPHFSENPKAYLFRYNRSLHDKVLNGSVKILKDLPPHLWFHAQVYKFASMEYRLFPINFSMDVCKIIEKDTFGTSNIWATTNRRCCCPLTKGPLIVKNYLLNQTNLPPFVPRGMFKVDVTLSIYDDVKLGNASLYYEIETIIPWQKK